MCSFSIFICLLFLTFFQVFLFKENFLLIRGKEMDNNNMDDNNCGCFSQNCCRATIVASRIVRLNINETYHTLARTFISHQVWCKLAICPFCDTTELSLAGSTQLPNNCVTVIGNRCSSLERDHHWRSRETEIPVLVDSRAFAASRKIRQSRRARPREATRY